MSDDRRPKPWHDAFKATGLAMQFLDGVSCDAHLNDVYARSAVERQILIAVEVLNQA